MKKKWILQYIIYFALLFIPIAIFRDFTPDNELRYISISNEMIQNGYHFILKTHGNIYTDKPPLYIWLISLSKFIFGNYNSFVLCLFSIIPSFLIVLILNYWAKEKLNETELETGSLMLITTGIFMASTVTIRMDMLMSLFITLSLFFFYRIYSQTNKKYEIYGLYFSIFFALFTKGPMGLIIPILSIILFLIIKKDKETIKKLNIKIGLLILFGLTGLWFFLVFREGGKEYLSQLIFKQTVNRSIHSFAHARPFYYYLKNMFYTFAPWSFIYLYGVINSVKNFRKISDLEKLFLIIILSTFIFLSFVSGKLDIYLLPIYVFCPYLSIMRLKEVINKEKIYFYLTSPFLIILAIGQIAIPFIIKKDMEIKKISLIILVFSFFIFLISILKFKDKNINLGTKFAYIGMVLFILFFTLNINSVNEMIGLKKISTIINSIPNSKDYTIYTYKEEDYLNMDVFIDKKLNLIREEDNINFIINGKNNKIILFKSRHYKKLIEERSISTKNIILFQNKVFTLVSF
ncbi:MAG: glycosyltransferase family 39 protein [Fusobacteriaceae bacterium]|nr:glycosyltransferase family 39 protein [Fusobacteriaceae bacterium]